VNFNLISQKIQQLHASLYKSAVSAVNTHITIRNWIIGFYIVELEQNGSDKATYGEKLLPKLASTIKIKGLSAPELSRCRQFYLIYPEIFGTLSQEFNKLLPDTIFGTVSQKFKDNSIQGEFPISQNYAYEIITKISFSHFVELIKIKDITKRRFFELIVMKNTLSVRELDRQIATLAFERVGLSKDTKNAINELENKISPTKADDAIKSIYFFDFLNLQTDHLIQENQLEQALISHLEKFILELGNGFCYEARQKRLLIDDEYFFVDLVFYHRIIKCHVLIELKVDKFKHEYLSQLNSYVAYYNHNIKRADDNPTIGILLCAEKGTQMVEYAMAGMTQKLFVSKYLVELPSKEILVQFIEDELKKRK